MRLLILLVLIPLLFILSSLSANAEESLRLSEVINRDWLFTLGDQPGAEAPEFNDSTWSRIGLPHSFSIPYFQSTHFYVGYGWYRKKLVLTAEQLRGKRVFLEFDAVFQDTEVYMNGKRVGHHMGGYNGFSYDITDAVIAGQNVIAVRVNNLWNPRLAPRAGEHVFSGGIYRDVRLLLTDPLHVTWYGTFVTTPKLSAESGTVNVQTEVRNDSSTPSNATLRTDILDDQGSLITTVTSTVSVGAGQTVNVDQTTPTVPHPRLWSPQHPTLYTAVSTLMDGAKTRDLFKTTFGFRWIAFTQDQGFFLNGQHYYFKGANVHQDRAGWGDAGTDAAMVRDVQAVKDSGLDFIRGSHYPHSPAFTTACDRIGVMCWSENCFWGTGGQSSEGYWTASAYPVRDEDDADFEQSVADSLRDMIRIHRNHPSIIVWSMSNEPFFSDGHQMDKVRALLKKLVALSHQLDPTRPAAIGGCQRQGLDVLGDVAGLNGDGANFRNLKEPSVISEYGSTQENRPGSFIPGYGDLTHSLKPDEIAACAWRFPWRSGESLWCAFDHGSIAGRKFGSMGFIDYYRLPKRMWYWYRENYAHVPHPTWPVSGTPAALQLTASSPSIQHADGTDDVQIKVTVVDNNGTWISNAMPVTFSVESGPGELPTGRRLTFDPKSDITMADGLAAIDMRAYYSGNTVLKASAAGLPDAKITIPSSGGPSFVPGQTLLCTERPYLGASGADQRALQEFGLNNPTEASSQATGHEAPNANDGNDKTWWQAADSNTGAWWMVDLERNVSIEKVSMKFPSRGAWKVKIEVSADKVKWTPFAESDSSETAALVFEGKAQSTSGFVRVTFEELPKGQSAQLTELRVTGQLTGQ